MFLHLGADVSIYSDEVIGIFDIKLVSSPTFREFLDVARWNDSIHIIDRKSKSIVITEKGVYYSPVSRATLARRWQTQQEFISPGLGFKV